MKDLRDRKPTERERGSVDPVSERLVVVVVAWMAAAILLPLHLLFFYGLFFTQPAFGVFALIFVFGLPLAVVDFVAYRWFRDNFAVFRWINRSEEAHRRKSGGR